MSFYFILEGLTSSTLIKFHFENGIKKTLKLPWRFFYQTIFCDLGRIQTCNRLSRNQVFYSVELRGQIKYEVIDIIGF